MSGRLIPLRRVEGVTDELSDEALVAAVGTGDGPALGALFDRFHDVVYRFVGRLGLLDDDARDDLVQATFLEVRRAARGFAGRSTVRTWILGIAANLARHDRRGERRRRARQLAFVAVPAAAEAPLDAQLDRRRLLQQVERAVGALPHDQQVAFALCDLEQLPGAEVARALGIPEGTLWRRLHDARKAIRAAIDREAR
ncbi:MAG: RNA polymerase sigma factor [Kofleriaceae bacterium]|jgi:RNA polymerase sigma-70 factor (ECF subfamily)|nr:RNA polymerase sigma factor [Kofleriaceae bacterium]MBP9165784.1 RNA polymerase sigma factor [Kofleriaceae bacterium]MBP9857933.1 RNA polymerase sigma factor [Kofleriaceae bacterium]